MISAIPKRRCAGIRLRWPVREAKNGRFGPLTGEYRTSWNGIYQVVGDHLETCPPFKAFLAFRDLRRLGTQIASQVEGDARVYALAAKDEKNAGAYIVNFSEEQAEVEFRGETLTLEPYTFIERKWELSV